MKSFIVRDYNGYKCIDSLSLYGALGMPRLHYARWAINLSKFGTEGVDFFKQKQMIFDPQKHNIRRRYNLTLEFACELCAAAKSQTGRDLKMEFRRIIKFPNKN